LDALDEKLGRKPTGSSPKPTKAVSKGKKLPQKEFRQPLIVALRELGGSAHVTEIRNLMERKIAPVLNDGDYEKVSTGEVRWWNATCWERANMVRDGLIAESSERGVWELTNKPTVKVYRYRRPYDARTDSEAVADRMATREFIERFGLTLIEGTELEVDSSLVNAEGQTALGFAR
jgi:hypothetical protein